MLEQAIPAGVPVAEVLPAGQVWARLICSGRVLEPDEYSTYRVQPNDEVLAIPQWGTGLEAFLIPLGILGIARESQPTTALSYLLFPPAKPHIQGGAIDEPTFSFEGIRTTIGPGQVVPVIYGRHRVGGQLLSASVDQARTFVDTTGPGSRHQVEALSAPPTLTMLLALGEGPVADIVTTSIEINGQPISNFPSVQTFTRAGTADQTPMPEFGETANTFADGRTIGDDPGITYTTTMAVQGFALNIAFQEGLYYLTEKGQKEDNVSHVQYRYRPTGGAYPDWTTFEVAAARTSVVRFAIRREGLPLSGYDIQLRFAGARIMNELRAKWLGTLESVTELLHNTNAYPHTALLGIRSVATDALQGALPNITIIVYGRTVRMGSFSAAETWTDNPAWCLLDLMTHPRYGLNYPDGVMDLAAFAAWGAYCDQFIDGEARHRMNYVLDREVRAQPLLMEMAGMARTILLKSEGLWTPRVTRDETPVQLLNWANVSNLTLTYTRDPDRINVIEGRFINEDNDFQSDVLTWPSVDHWPGEVRKASLDLRGITKASRVQRALQFELNRRRFEVLSLEMDCAPDALVLQVHDVFRFAHPLPGWGTSGRILPGSTTTTLIVDTPVTFEAGKAYHVYVRHHTDLTELRPVINPGDTRSVLSLATPMSFAPIPYDCVWACGESSPIDTAQRPFRVVRMARNADHSVHLQAIAHNPTLYDEATAEALPEITTLFNPLGPAPPLTSLVLMEVTRVEPSGASLRVVNLSWDVAPLSRGLAPYGGALIQRRTVLTSTTGGLGEAGTQALGGALEANAGNYIALTQVSGHVLDFDDYTVVTATTYDYRVIPVSQRGVPNNVGAREGRITVTGPTTPDFFPGTPFNLRLKGKTPLDTIFEGRNVDLEWDPPTGLLFSETFYIQDYLMEVWAPGQLYLLRRTTVPARTAGEVMSCTYTLEQNTEDQAQAGYIGARRDLHFFVWARTNTNRVSLTPGQLLVNNPPPDMGDMIPVVTSLFEAALISFDQYVEPRDFDHYEVHLDTVNPPIAIYENVAIGFLGQGSSFRKIAPQGLTVGVTYYVYILPYDTFGPGIPTQIASFVPSGLTADSLDNTPPAIPTGLVLTTGTVVSHDGTIMPWVRASWTPNTESDIAAYEVHFRVLPSLVPTALTVSHPTTFVRLENIAGNVTVGARLLAYDQFHNPSPFTAEVTITTSRDTVAPGVPTTTEARGSFRANVILWTPPSDLDYLATEVWHSFTNDLATAAYAGESFTSFVHEGLASGFASYYWVRAKDTSDNFSPFVPSQFAGLLATTVTTSNEDIGNLSITETKIANDSISTPKLQANSVDANKVTTGELITLGAQIRNALITNAHIIDLSANKIRTGQLRVDTVISVGTTIYVDGTNSFIAIYDQQAPQALRALLGKLGTLNTQYGLQLFNEAGALMWNFATGAMPDGVSNDAITTRHISAGSIRAHHLVTDQLVVTTAAQIAFAIITDAHITNLAVEKLLAGTINVAFNIGVSAGLGTASTIALDGVNQLITVYDTQVPQRARIWLGRLGLGGSEFGMRIWNSNGDLMWDFNSGASSLGIQDLAVTSAKIGTAQITSAHIGFAQITSAHIGDLQVDNAKIANLTVGTGKIASNAVTVSVAYSSLAAVNSAAATEVFVTNLSFPEVNPGDQILMWASASGAAAVDNALALRIREDSMAGAEYGYGLLGSGNQGVVFAQAVYVVAAPAFNKNFFLTMQNPLGLATVSMDHIKFTGLLRKK